MLKKGGPLVIFYLLFYCVVAFAQGRNSCPEGPHTLYSRDAITLDPASDHPVRVISPDGKTTLIVRTISDKSDPDGVHISYDVIAGENKFTANLPGFNGEIASAPVSKAFAWTHTDV